MGGPTKKRRAVPASIPRSVHGGVATLPVRNACEEPVTFQLTVPRRRLDMLTPGAAVAVRSTAGQLELVSGGATLGLVPAKISGRVKKCMSSGFVFDGAINQIDDTRPELTITIAGVQSASS